MDHRALTVPVVVRPVYLLLVAGALLLGLVITGCDMPGAPSSPASAAPTSTPAPPPATQTPLAPTATPLPPTETPIPPSPTPPPRTLTGHVLDSYTGRPVSGARVTAPGAS